MGTILSSQRENKQRGFSLVEMLAFLVVAGIGMAFLLKVLLGYIAQAGDARRMLEASKVFTACQSYVVEYTHDMAGLTKERYNFEGDHKIGRAELTVQEYVQDLLGKPVGKISAVEFNGSGNIIMMEYITTDDKMLVYHIDSGWEGFNTETEL